MLRPLRSLGLGSRERSADHPQRRLPVEWQPDGFKPVEIRYLGDHNLAVLSRKLQHDEEKKGGGGVVAY